MAWAEGVAREDIVETEAYYYPAQKVLGVQFHPEYMNTKSNGFTFYVDMLRTALNANGGSNG